MELFAPLLPYFAGIATITAMALTAVHVILHKRDIRAAVGWLGLVWFAPVLGIVLYWAFGINRIQRRARIVFSEHQAGEPPAGLNTVQPEDIGPQSDEAWSGLIQLAGLSGRITAHPLTAGNAFYPLQNGDQAYPAMLRAIREARESISLSTYIFDNDAWGKQFKPALRRALDRGVQVRVLIDDIGARYSFPSMARALRQEGIPTARFLQSWRPWRFRYYNLRNHRKILVLDGTSAFTGGMNIRSGHVLKDSPRHPIQDLHFRVQGPVVAEIQRVFADDWQFTTGEALTGPAWFPGIRRHGKAVARGIADGPDEDYDKLRSVLLGALSCARRTIRIATPYFLPDEELASGLKVAAMKGLTVEIAIPEKGNLKMVHWAAWGGLEDLVKAGCRIMLTPPPFDHSKAMVVDGRWVLLGSANWDSRSLRLNFEFNVEVYDSDLARDLERLLRQKNRGGRVLSLEDIQQRSLAVHLRDSVFRLFSPYL